MVRKASNRGTYSTRSHGAPVTNTGYTSDDRIVVKDINALINRPKWDVPRPGQPPKPRNVYRILPVVSPNDPDSLVPFRYSDEPGDFGEFLYGCFLGNNIGTNKLNFVLGDRRDFDETTIYETPLATLNASLVRALSVGEGHADWKNLVKVGKSSFGERKAPPLITNPVFSYLLQVAVVSHIDKPADKVFWGLDDDDPLIILAITSNAGASLIAQLDACCALDPVSLDKGLFIDVHSVDNPPAGADTSHITSEYGYAITLLEDFNGITPDLSAREDDVRNRVKWWDDIIYIPDTEEQVRWICESNITASALLYGLESKFNEYIPPAVREAAQRANRASNDSAATRPNIPQARTNDDTPTVVTNPGRSDSPAKIEDAIKNLRERRGGR